MKLGDAQRLLREVDAGDARAAARHGLRKDPAAAADIEHLLPRELRMAVDPLQAQGIDIVQRLEFARRVPPAGRAVVELADFRLVDVRHRSILPKKKPRRGRARLLGGRAYGLRVPMTSISVRRSGCRHSTIF